MAVGALFAIQVRLRLPRTDTRAVAPVACFAVLRLFRAATAESRTALIRRTPTAMIDSTRMRMEVSAAHRIVVTLIAQSTQHSWRGTYAGHTSDGSAARIAPSPKSGTSIQRDC
jgi:hypothetical protein